MPLETKRALIVVRTYPTPAKQGIEVSCTGGHHRIIGQWLRLFPVPYRFLDSDKRFRKFQSIDVQVSKATDHRIESYKIENNSIAMLTSQLPTDHALAQALEGCQAIREAESLLASAIPRPVSASDARSI